MVQAKNAATPHHRQPGELFNLRQDLSERQNLYAERPEIGAGTQGTPREVQTRRPQHAGQTAESRETRRFRRGPEQRRHLLVRAEHRRRRVIRSSWKENGRRVRIGEGISGGLSQFSFDENGTVPFGCATVVVSPILTSAARLTSATRRRRLRPFPSCPSASRPGPSCAASCRGRRSPPCWPTARRT